ncbi:hypothetical protein BH24CHL7_BH24CHL7_08920 [soil metagenome]
MEWVLIGGLVVILALVALAGFVMFQRRRAGTIKAVVAPHRGTNRPGPEQAVGKDGEEDAT